DSLGRLTTLEEFGVDPQTPSVAPQTRIFDSWGNITAVQWCDDKSPGPSCPGKERGTVTRFDGRNRVTHREDRIAGQTVAETVAAFTYDQNPTVLGIVGPTGRLGRLASATWPTGQEWFHYDAFGRVDARTFVDTSVVPPPPPPPPCDICLPQAGGDDPP